MNRTDIPAPLYAAAGAGELAYQKLRQLPEVAARTMRSAEKAAEDLRRRLATRERDLTADWSKVRESAQRGTAVVVAKAATAQERASTGYRNLVARGERVMSERLGVTTGHAEPADIQVEVGPVRGAKRPSDADSAAGSAAPPPATTPTTPTTASKPSKPTTPSTPVSAGVPTTPAASGTTPTD